MSFINHGFSQPQSASTMAQHSPQIAGVMVQSTKSESLEQRLFPAQQVFIEKTGDIVKVNGRYEVTRLPDGSYQVWYCLQAAGESDSRGVYMSKNARRLC